MSSLFTNVSNVDRGQTVNVPVPNRFIDMADGEENEGQIYFKS